MSSFSTYFNLDATDIDDFMLSYEISTVPQHGSYILNQSFLTYTPNDNYFGLDSLFYVVSDTSLESSSAWVNFTIMNIDDPPELPELLNATIDEDTAYSIQLPLLDIDNDTLVYNIQLSDSDYANYTLDELVSSYNKLKEVLTQANKCWFQGTKPTKQWERTWI